MTKLKDLNLDRHNANKGSARGQKLIVGSIQRNGFGRSGLLDAKGNVIAGNKTTEAAAEVFGVEAEPIIIETDGKRPVYVKRTDLNIDDPDPNNPARRLAYEDNLTSHFSFELDPTIVMADIEAGFDFEAIDISLVDLGGMLEGAAAELLRGNGAGNDAEPQIDKAQQLKEKWGVELGQLWQLGEHRLICGDCTDKATVERVMRGDRAEMMFTDPPYGVDYTGGHFHSGDVNIKRERPRLANDKGGDIYAEFLPIALPFIDGPCYVWFADRGGKPVFDAVTGNGCEIHAMIIWNKINATYAAIMAQYHQRHEPCLYFKPKKSTLRWVGPGNECTIWEVKRDATNEFHPTQKPVELAERAINNHSANIVLDCFLGSGTTLIACENLNRRCRAIEIDPGYVAVSLQRWADLTGKTPQLLENLES